MEFFKKFVIVSVWCLTNLMKTQIINENNSSSNNNSEITQNIFEELKYSISAQCDGPSDTKLHYSFHIKQVMYNDQHNTKSQNEYKCKYKQNNSHALKDYAFLFLLFLSSFIYS